MPSSVFPCSFLCALCIRSSVLCMEPLAGPAAALLRNAFHPAFLPGPHFHSFLRLVLVVMMPPCGVAPAVLCSTNWGCAHHCGCLFRAPGGAAEFVPRAFCEQCYPELCRVPPLLVLCRIRDLSLSLLYRRTHTRSALTQ
jgi:hypothetical protein